jgi:hypothetical protein
MPTVLGGGTLVSVFAMLLVVTSSGAGAPVSHAWVQIQRPSALLQDLETNLAWNPLGGYEMAVGHDASGKVQTFALQDGKWTNLGVHTPQMSALSANLVYDASDHAMLLVIDFTGTLGPVRLYTFTGGGWNLVTAPGGPVQSVDYPPAVVYDVSDGYVLYYGGSTPGCDCGSTLTWSYHAGVWHQFRGINFPARVEFPLLAYDPALGKVLLYNNGANGASTDFEFWTFHAGSWVHVRPADRPQVSGAMGYDYAEHALLLTGTTPWGAGPYVFLWPDGGSFMNVTAETHHAGVDCVSVALTGVSYDPGQNAMVCIGENTVGAITGLWAFT